MDRRINRKGKGRGRLTFQDPFNPSKFAKHTSSKVEGVESFQVQDFKNTALETE